MTWQQKVVETGQEAAKKLAKSETARNAGKKAVEVAATAAGAIGAARFKKRRARKEQREKTIALARQISGKYSEDTIVDGEQRFVVWNDGRAFDCFPRPEGAFSRDDFANRPELQDFPDHLLKTPPPS